LSDLRELLLKDVAVAAPVLCELTGPVIVHQRHEEGKNKPVWIAEFAVNWVPVMLMLKKTVATKVNCPTTSTLEYLCARSWTHPQQVEVRLEHVPQYELLGSKFAELYHGGAKIQEIASAYGMPWKQAKEILDFGLTGKRPKWPAHAHHDSGSNAPPLHEQIRDDVVRLRDEEKRTWPKIVDWLKNEKGLAVSEGTVRRAYDNAHQEEMRGAVNSGKTPDRGRWRHIPEKTIRQIRRLLKAGKLTPSEIARKVGVSPQTVYRERDAQ
jgi:DNA-binding transcriptional ArsR family regulator